MIKFISVDEYLMGRTTMDKLTPEQVGNLNTIVPRANELLEAFGEYRKVNSGYRSREDQMRINPSAPLSKHTICAAVDLEDKDGRLKAWCMANLGMLSKIGLWMESPKSTPTWVHVQSIAPRSGSRVFTP
jgi:uncharacterized protein YcbK (DUF882 family)